MEFVAGSGEEGTSHAQEPGDHGCIFQLILGLSPACLQCCPPSSSNPVVFQMDRMS